MPNQILLPNDMTSYSSADITKVVTGNVYQVIVRAGYWNTDGTIILSPSDSSSNLYTDAEITAFITMCKNANPNVKVFAWIIGGFGANTKFANDVSTAGGKRSTMYAAEAAVLAKGFDGFADDIEPYNQGNPNGSSIANIVGTWAEYITYTNGMIAAAHTVGKLYMPFISGGTPSWGAPDSFWSSITTADYLGPMFYSDFPFSAGNPSNDLASQMDHILSIAGSPVVMWLAAGGAMYNTDYNNAYNNGNTPIIPAPTLTNQQTAIDNKLASHGTYSKLVGFGIWNYGIMTSSEWTNWVSWNTKNMAPITHAITLQSNPTGVKYTQPNGTAPFQVQVNDQGQITVQVPNQISI